MKALFIKELRKGRWLPLFGLGLGLLVAVLRGFFGAYPPLLTKSAIDDENFFAIVSFASLALAMIAGAGLFASEAERATLPLLLALPLSRGRIWLAKVLAGFVLALSASVLLELMSLLALPGTIASPVFEDDLLTFGLWWFVVLSASASCSPLLKHTISAFMAAVLVSGGLLAFVFAVVRFWGGSLLGFSAADDASLWATAFIPGLLLGSLLALCKGEILRSGRRWLFGVGGFVLVGGPVVFVTGGTMHWVTRYERTRVERIGHPILAQNTGYASLDAMRSPVKWEWTHDGLELRGTPHYRARYLVLVDLRSGRDVLARKGDGAVDVSTDGRLVAVVEESCALTWRAEDSSRWWSIDVRDLKAGRALYRGWPADLAEYRRADIGRIDFLSWSRDDRWLAIQPSFHLDRLLLMRSNGSAASALPLWPHSWFELRNTPSRWAWDASGEGVYTLAAVNSPRGRAVRLLHHTLPAGRSTCVWTVPQSLRLPHGYDWLTHCISVSADGRLLVVSLVAGPFELEPDGVPEPEMPGATLVFVFLITPDGTQSRLISKIWMRGSLESLACAWSRDCRSLYYLAVSESDAKLYFWQSGQIKASDLELRPCPEKIARLPDQPGVLVWTRRDVGLATGSSVVPFPNSRVRSLAQRYALVGIDNRGRAIVYGRDDENELAAVDLATGKLTRLYP